MNANLLRRLNWLWKHRHTHDNDVDCCASLPELRLQIDTVADIRQHTQATTASFNPENAVSFEADSSTTHPFDVPEGITAGDIGIANLLIWGTPGTVTWPAGWTVLTSNAAGNYVLWRRLDGAETDTTFTTENASNSLGLLSIVPKGSADSLPDPEASSWASETNSLIDSPAFTPSTPGRHLVMSLWGCHGASSADDRVPDGYAVIGPGLDKTVEFKNMNGAYAFVDIATSENPPAWSTGTSLTSAWHAVTVGVLMEGAPGQLATPDDIITDHGELDGLADDDHDQYVKADGTRAFTGEVSGVIPTTDPALATKGYVDSVAGTDADAIHDNVSGEIAAVTEKATPVSADLILIEDSAASNVKKKVQIGNLPGGGASALDDLSDVTITSPTTGQVVKYDGTGWVNDTDSTGSGSLPASPVKGDLAVHNGTDWVRVGVGSNDQVLTADSAESAGVKWATASGGSGVIGAGSGATVVDTVTASGASPLSFTKPGGLADGDLIVMAGATVNSLPDVNGPDGDSSWETLYVFDTLSNEYHFAYYKVAASEGASWTLAHSAGSEVASGIVIYRGVNDLWSFTAADDTFQCGWTIGHPEGLQVCIWPAIDITPVVPIGDGFTQDLVFAPNRCRLLIAHRDTVSSIDGFPLRAIGTDSGLVGALNMVFYDNTP